MLFSILAAGVFAIGTAGGRADERTIVITPAVTAELERALTQELGRAPTAAERIQALERWKLDEAAAREAVALGLGRDDPQVLSLLRERVAEAAVPSAPAPSERELEAYLESHRAAFERPERYDFEQVFLDPQKPGAEARARSILSALEAGAAPTSLGDSFRFGYALVGESFARVRAVFGPEFAEALSRAEPGRWQIVRSAAGLHVVRLLKKFAGRSPALGDVEKEVSAALEAERKTAHERAALRALVARYRFVESSD